MCNVYGIRFCSREGFARDNIISCTRFFSYFIKFFRKSFLYAFIIIPFSNNGDRWLEYLQYGHVLVNVRKKKKKNGIEREMLEFKFSINPMGLMAAA